MARRLTLVVCLPPARRLCRLGDRRPRRRPAHAGRAATRRAHAMRSRRQDIARDLRAFADDSMLGRNAETGDAVRAARFLAARAAAIGLEPAGDSGGFLQRVPLVREYLGRDSRATVATDIGNGAARDRSPTAAAPLARREDFRSRSSTPRGICSSRGYGFSAPGIPDPLEGKSVAGKVVVFLMESPPGLDSARARTGGAGPPARAAHRRARRPRTGGDHRGGLGAGGGDPPVDRRRDARLGRCISSDGRQPRPRTLPMVLLVDARIAAPLLPPARRAPKGTRSAARAASPRTWTGCARRCRRTTWSACGGARDSARRGTLRRLRRAPRPHRDPAAVGGDSIANGADDDGSGSVALLAIARAAVAQRPAPARSMLFVWHTGEELGLFGSEWFTTHPTVPLDSIVAQLNADMIGRNAPDSLYLVGPRAAPKRQSAVLGVIADSVNADAHAPLPRSIASGTRRRIRSRSTIRSDHYNYARNGIPVVFFTSGSARRLPQGERRAVEDRLREDRARGDVHLRGGTRGGGPADAARWRAPA